MRKHLTAFGAGSGSKPGFALIVLAGLLLPAVPALSGDGPPDRSTADRSTADRPTADQSTTDRLTTLANGDWRPDANKARNGARHPVETLVFFGIRDHMTVVELMPGGGWYMEILAPFLKDRGTYYAAGFPRDAQSSYAQRLLRETDARIAARPDLYGKVITTALTAETGFAPAGSADMVLTFRNLHNWMSSGELPVILANVHRALKPGGIFGVVEHRADPKAAVDPKAQSGYVNEAYIIGVIEKAGFGLEASSEINANPRDSRNHPKGVWTLPPTYALGDQDRATYSAIGESDRMTLRFRRL